MYKFNWLNNKLGIISCLTILFLTLSFIQIAIAENSEGDSSSENRMFGRWLNHTHWDGVSFTTKSGLNNLNYTIGTNTENTPSVVNGYVYQTSYEGFVYQLNASNITHQINVYNASRNIIASSPNVAGGYVYLCNSFDEQLLQLNASNVSLLVANFTVGNCQSHSSVANGYVYVGSSDNQLYQLNASNVSLLVANYTTGADILKSAPAIANGYVYVGSSDNQLYQLNASNVSLLVANFTTGGDISNSPAVYEGYVYVGSDDEQFYQLNASNVSLLVANYTTRSGDALSSPAVANGYVYVGSSGNSTYQLNASNVSLLVANYTISSGFRSSPTIANGYVYIGADNNQMYQLNASNVSLLVANYTTGADIISGNAYADRYIYFASYDGQIYQILAGNISDQTNPGVTINSPVNQQTYASSSITINFSLTERGSCNYTLSGASTQYVLTANNTLNQFNYTRSSLGNGNYTLTAYCLDTTGNANFTRTSEFTIWVTSSDGSSSSGSSSGTTNYNQEYNLTESQISNGYEKNLLSGERFGFKLGNERHSLVVNTFNSSQAKVTISSDPQIVYLQKGQETQIDVDKDGDKELIVEYRGISSSRATIYIKSLANLGTQETNQNLSLEGDSEAIKENEGEERSYWYIIIIAILILMGAGIYYAQQKGINFLDMFKKPFSSR